MKRRFLAALVVLVLAGLLVAAMERDPGYVLVAYGGYSLEMSVWVGLVLGLLLIVLLTLLGRLIRGGLRFGFSGQGWWHRRRQRRQQRRTTEAIIAYIEGRWGRARKLLERAAEGADEPLLHYLAAARASSALGDWPSAQAYLARATDSTPGARVAVELTQAELQLDQGQLEDALATLQRARRNAGRHPYVLDLLQRVYCGLKDWSSLLELLPELRRHAVLPAERINALERDAYRAQLAVLGGRQGDQEGRHLRELWRSMPKSLQRDPGLVSCYVQQLLERGATAEAVSLLYDQLKRSWHHDLVRLYGLIEGPDPQRQLLVAEQWLPERNNDAMLLLTLGRLALRNELWGKARDYLETSLKLEEKPETCAELGRLLAHLNEPVLSSRYFQRGLLVSTPGLPSLPMPDRRRLTVDARSAANSMGGG